MTRFDVAVVGGGPAGLAAAASATAGGARVAIVDGAPRLGGQFWRHRPGHEPAAYRRARAAAARAEHIANSPVWYAEPGFRLHTAAGIVDADRLILATGAHDRSLPFPGWDLPGVITAGGAQALLKGQGVLVGRRVVVAGAGPFLLAVAAGLAGAGARVLAVIEAGRPSAYARRPGAVVRNPAKLAEAARYATALARHRIPYRTGHAVVAAHGTDAVEAVTVARLHDGATRTLDVDALAISYGFTPQLELPLALGCATRVDADGSLVVDVDDSARTSVEGVFAAGEVTGVGGAVLSIVEGQIAGRAATDQPIDPRLTRRRAAAGRFAAAMHAAHPTPESWPDWLGDDTLVCRCEEVPFERIRHAVETLGATDIRSVKLLTRTGMGWCQGRICGAGAACLVARLAGRPESADDLIAITRRPLAQPVTLGTLAERG